MRAGLDGFLAALVLIVLAGPAAAQDDPAARAAALLAQAKAASGGAAWDRLAGWRESGTAIIGEAQGDYDTWCDLHRLGMANHHVLAGAAQTRGFDGATVWLVDGAGQLHTSQAPLQLAIARQGAYVSAWGFFFPERFATQRVYIGSASADGADFDIVRATPEGGLPMELWIDRKTHLITRMVDRSGPRTSVAVLSDFRSIGGVVTPFVVAESDGDPKHTLELHLTAIDFGPIDPARFAPPAR
ncbi:MAG: hypothetical protein P4L73_12185 [Caulobacteraceae bacterium]|nr:hypothetical protein [Caulobacteraceae bacterium]